MTTTYHTAQGELIAAALSAVERLSGYITEPQHVSVSASGSAVEVDIHGTTPRVIDHLLAVYGSDDTTNVREDADGIVRWLTLDCEGVEVTFYRR